MFISQKYLQEGKIRDFFLGKQMTATEIIQYTDKKFAENINFCKKHFPGKDYRTLSCYYSHYVRPKIYELDVMSRRNCKDDKKCFEIIQDKMRQEMAEYIAFKNGKPVLKYK